MDLVSVEAGREKIVRREFFEAHRCRILLIDFLENSSLTMVTVDEEGLVALWPYSRDYYTGNMWFRPRQTMRLNLMMYDLTVDDEAEKVDVYCWYPGDSLSFEYESLRKSTNINDLRYYQVNNDRIAFSFYHYVTEKSKFRC